MDQTAAADSPLPAVGARLITQAPESSKATVLYVGPVEGTRGLWLGVQWDDWARGRHDGSYKGRRYFEPSGGDAASTSCSFVRPSKVAAYGCGLATAVAQRYGAGAAAGLDAEAHVGRRRVELVGMESVASVQSAAGRLRTVALDRCNVAVAMEEADEAGWLAANLANCRVLDLADNLIRSWAEVVEMVRLLPRIGELILSKNSLDPILGDDDDYGEHTGKIGTLVLNECSIADWTEVESIIERFANVRTLCLSANPIRFVSATSESIERCFANVTSLDLERVAITDWADVRPLTWMRQLKSLNVAKTSLDRIDFGPPPPADPSVYPETPWPALEELYVHKCRIGDWRSVSALDALRSLQRLVVHGNPVLDEFGADTGRQMVIARVGRLRYLDRVEIFASERRGAEIDYVARYGERWAARDGDIDAFAADHPRYAALVDVHGAADRAETRSLTTARTLVDRLVAVTLDVAGGRPTELRLPDAMTVGRLRAVAARRAKARRPADVVLRLCCESAAENEVSELELDNDLRQVRFYSIQNGDTIRVTVV